MICWPSPGIRNGGCVPWTSKSWEALVDHRPREPERWHPAWERRLPAGSGVWTFFERGGGTRPVRRCIRLCIPTGFRNKAQGCPAKRELPWVKWPNNLTTPTGLRPGASAQTPRRLGMEDRRKIETQPRWGCDLDQRFPRVAPTSQPWALLRNPFGISSAKISKLQGPLSGKLSWAGGRNPVGIGVAHKEQA